MTIEINEHHFARQDDAEELGDRRPKMLSQASTNSVFAGTTTALSETTINEDMIIDHRNGIDSSDGASIRSRKPTLRSIDSDLVTSMSQALSTNSSILSSARPLADTGSADIDIETDTGYSLHEEPRGLSAKEVSALPEEAQLADFLGRQKHFLMLSAAGKPIYALYGTEQVISGYMGILQAIMGFYQESTTPDVLQSFSSSAVNIVMLVKGPVYLVSISKHSERESTMRGQLEFLYDAVVSSLTSTSMSRCFDRGDNFDLGRLLSGSEAFMDKICDGLTYGRLHFDILFGALAVLRLRATLRQKLNNILATHRPSQASLLYAMLAVDKKLVSVLRPKGHSMYPADLRLVFETVWERGFEEGQEYWFPLCLPKFNSTGYLHIFACFLAPSLAIILIAADKDDFFQLQQMKSDVLHKMNKEGLVRDLIRARHNQVTTELLTIDDVVEHFVFKSKSRVQYLSPDIHVQSTHTKGQQRSQRVSKRDLVRIYEDLQNLQGTRHKLQIHHYDLLTSKPDQKVLALSWITSEFELFVVSTPQDRQKDNQSDSSRHVAELIGSSNVIHQFVKREDGRVWLHDGLTF